MIVVDYSGTLNLYGNLVGLDRLLRALPGEVIDPEPGTYRSFRLFKARNKGLFQRLDKTVQEFWEHHQAAFAALHAAGGRAECVVRWEVPRLSGGVMVTECMRQLASLKVGLKFELVERRRPTRDEDDDGQEMDDSEGGGPG